MAQFSVKIMRLTGSVLGENQQFEDNATPQSRLACQISISDVPEGLTFTVAGEQ